ncbi:unnamed protein product [Cylindrotheca closterium]|uniref:Uncharacterized protein n=1 Tax=Cylindrotheca closterium TaxID=2856 RepID=A0AAD2CQD1_9STRA|nr:unnamed protein product [Cylindrotheca closterium]
MNEPNQHQGTTNNNDNTTTAMVLAVPTMIPAEWSPPLPPLEGASSSSSSNSMANKMADQIKLENMRLFVNEGITRVSSMLDAICILNETRVQQHLAQYQTPLQAATTTHAIQELQNYTQMHWHQVTLVYQEFWNMLGYRGPPVAAVTTGGAPHDSTTQDSAPPTTTISIMDEESSSYEDAGNGGDGGIIVEI